MSANEDDFEAVQEAVETLEENGFKVESVDRIFGFTEHDYHPDEQEEEELGRKTCFDLAVEKEHY